MRRTVDATMVCQSFRYVPGRSTIYLSNAKAGCSGFAAALWKDSDLRSGRASFTGNAHALELSPFVTEVFDAGLDKSEIANATFFSVVRNPFVRILSGYLDKIRGRKIVWKRFAARFGLPQELPVDRLNFRDFLVILSSEPDELIDAHFRPQYLNLLWPICRPHFVGQLEESAPIKDFHAAQGLPMSEVREHATDARERLAQYYTPETVALVRDKFATDFALFGYAPDLGQVEPLCPVLEEAGGCQALVQWIANGQFPFERADHATAQFQRFYEAKSGSEKLSIAKEAGPSDDNWKRVHAYLTIALQAGDSKFAAALTERKRILRRAHRRLLPELFARLRGG